MELLGNCNQSEDLIQVIMNLNKSLLVSNIINDDDLQISITVLSALLDMDESILYVPAVTALTNILFDNESVKQMPLLDNLLKEVRLKSVRLSVLGTNIDCGTYDQKPLSTERERWVPDERDSFYLPEPGQTTNLTVTEPDLKTGKTCIREVIIDHDGYLVREISRRYEDIYHDESEEAFNTAYLNEIEKLKK